MREEAQITSSHVGLLFAAGTSAEKSNLKEERFAVAQSVVT